MDAKEPAAMAGSLNPSIRLRLLLLAPVFAMGIIPSSLFGDAPVVAVRRLWRILKRVW
jgi:hypothetical protein